MVSQGKKSTQPADPEVLQATQHHLRQNLQLWGTAGISGEEVLRVYSSEAQHLEELIGRTLSLGESNSALLLAPRGTGKSALVDGVLGQLKDRGVLGQGLVVRLSGLLHTDDLQALKEITRQLRLEEAAAKKVFRSFAENLSFLLESLRGGSKETAKPAIFLLDEFDLFCHHRNQTLLYNLFDAAQSAQAPICVLGLSCRLDVLELLEKRVKSRFSHRQIHLQASGDFTTHYLHTFKTLLHLPHSFSFKVMCLAQLDEGNTRLTPQMFSRAEALVTQDARTNTVRGLSALQLCLVIAMKHLAEVYDGEPFNFEMVYREYCKFSLKSSMQSFEKPVVFKAFDQLMGLELVRPVDQTCRVQREYELVQMMMTPGQVGEVLSQMPSLPTDLQRWASMGLVA
ncbi:origin recognition complex subunit 4-like isoform X2 [Portunus trituberculatus]|uniref:origin recognition complex subunit 4-like isoform X2 n=1 Tax=Portunus trituberculatus TaxID=210409 RepID=UPI001E1D1E9E|nr:origin recognition complex subunit 4-like isoform X2 [Portunus trituberculatus]XP_045106994.1 origin recognition complex subunit 4-like isoform X2 [Portunus trituberculatus]